MAHIFCQSGSNEDQNDQQPILYTALNTFH